MHCEPLVEQRAHIGCSLLHLTFEAAQASHEALSLGLRSLSEEDDLGADVGERMIGVDLEWSSTIGLCQCEVDGVKDIIVAYRSKSQSQADFSLYFRAAFASVPELRSHHLIYL